MQTLNYWKQFINTGRVEDYLSYINNDKNDNEQVKQSGENPYAGVHMCNRNDTETGAYWGI